MDFSRVYRATLLRAIDEAFRRCRKRDPACPNARVWMLEADWDCYDAEPAVEEEEGVLWEPETPTHVEVVISLLVACVSG
jgi:hypothetical protein